MVELHLSDLTVLADVNLNGGSMVKSRRWQPILGKCSPKEFVLGGIHVSVSAAVYAAITLAAADTTARTAIP
jgi:hypothetical protein